MPSHPRPSAGGAAATWCQGWSLGKGEHPCPRLGCKRSPLNSGRQPPAVQWMLEHLCCLASAL
eukprot:1290787-Alexandrium_andersonii.AAC.1